MDTTTSTRGEQLATEGWHGVKDVTITVVDFFSSSCDFRLNGRVKKRAMTTFERDRMMSKMSSQLDYKVCT